jgi:hypothetical protein
MCHLRQIRVALIARHHLSNLLTRGPYRLARHVVEGLGVAPCVAPSERRGGSLGPHLKGRTRPLVTPDPSVESDGATMRLLGLWHEGPTRGCDYPSLAVKR